MNKKLTRSQFDVLAYAVKYGYIEKENARYTIVGGRQVMRRTFQGLINQNLIIERFEGGKLIYTPTGTAAERISEEMKAGKEKNDQISSGHSAWVYERKWEDAPVYGIAFKNGTFGTMRSRKTLQQLVDSGKYLSVKQLAG